MHLVAGEAPEALTGLPAPQSVFVGGSGGRLPDLLPIMPRPFVINLAVMEHVATVLDSFPDAGVTQLGVSRSATIGDGHRLTALNPVYIVVVPR